MNSSENFSCRSINESNISRAFRGSPILGFIVSNVVICDNEDIWQCTHAYHWRQLITPGYIFWNRFLVHCIVHDLHKLWYFGPSFSIWWDLQMFFACINIENNCITQSSIFKSDANLYSYLPSSNIQFATWNLICWKWKLLVFHLSTCAMTATATTKTMVMSKSVSCSLSFVSFSFNHAFIQ